jgi:hypothetical protein
VTEKLHRSSPLNGHEWPQQNTAVTAGDIAEIGRWRKSAGPGDAESASTCFIAEIGLAQERRAADPESASARLAVR